VTVVCWQHKIAKPSEDPAYLGTKNAKNQKPQKRRPEQPESQPNRKRQVGLTRFSDPKVECFVPLPWGLRRPVCIKIICIHSKSPNRRTIWRTARTVGRTDRSSTHCNIIRRPVWPMTEAYQQKQEAQLLQRDRAMLFVDEYFAKSFKVTQDHSKWHCWVSPY